MAVLGIDLGTTNSVACVVQGADVRVLPDRDGNPLIPSVVSFHPSGDILVGHAARERRLLDARNTIYSVKRLIGRPYQSPEVRRAEERFPFELVEGPTHGVLVRARGETYTLPEISAFVLREVKTLAEAHLREPCPQAVVTVPANFNELQRSATKAAGRVAGLEVLRILNEPTAAALAYGYGKGSRERIAVFDLGGGTFDITILELAGDVFEVLATAGDTFLGGDDIDVLIAEKMADAFLTHHRFDPRSDEQAFERLRAAAEWAKCQLSTQTEVQLRVEELAYGEGGASLDLTFGMTRAALEGLMRPLISRAFDVCEDAMRVAAMRPTQLDNVVLVGGSTRIPMVRAMVEEFFGRPPLGHIDPDLVVARGAALQAAALTPADNLGRSAIGRVALKKASLVDLPPISEVVAATPMSVGQDRAPARPPPPPPPPPKKAPIAPGGSTLGFGSQGLPAVQDTDAWMPSLPPPTGHTPLVSSVPPSLAHPPPLLLDVTPHTLGVETVGGYCEPVIARNAAIPVEQTRLFTTGQDDQIAVSVRIVQGEARKLAENQLLGSIELTGLRPAARGQVKIGVTFLLDADGTLGVRAKDLETGREQSVRINLQGGIGEPEIAAMAARQARARR